MEVYSEASFDTYSLVVFTYFRVPGFAMDKKIIRLKLVVFCLSTNCVDDNNNLMATISMLHNAKNFIVLKE